MTNCPFLHAAAQRVDYPARVTRGGYLLYGCGQLGVMALARFFFQWVLTFAGSSDGDSALPLFAATSVGALFFAFRIFDGLTDPVAGAISDGWVSRGRQRRSLLWFSFLLPPLGLAMVFSPSSAMSESVRWVMLSAGMFVFFVGYTAYVIPYWSLVDDYSRGNLKSRAQLSNVLGVGVLVATGFGFVLSPILVDSYGYLLASIVWALPCAALMVLPYYAQPKAAPDESVVRGENLSLAKGFKLAFGHRRFLAAIILFAGGQMSFTVMTAAAPFIAVQLLGGTNKDVALLLGPFLLTAVIGFAGVPKLNRRYGWQRSVLGATLLLGVVYGGTGLLGATLVGTPLVTAMIVFGLAGPMASVILGLEGEAIASLAKEHQAEVTSVYFGVYNFIVKSLNGLALMLTGIFADAVVSYGAAAVRGMGFTAGALLVLAVLLYAVARPRTPSAAMPVA